MIPGYTNKITYPGRGLTSAGLGGAIPQQNLTGYHVAQYKRLYKSHREIALLLDKTLRAGYGCLEAGTVMAVDQNTDNLVPYTPDTISEEDPSRVFLLNDCSTADNFDVELLESYKLASGETIVMTDSDGTYEQATISGVDRSSSNYKANITLTGSTSNNFTVAKSANCYVKAEDASGDDKASKAKYVLDMAVDTGAGEDAEGGLGAVLLSNAVIYKDATVGMDSTAITDLGNVSEDGAYYILK